jgi:hypothetical protein
MTAINSGTRLYHVYFFTTAKMAGLWCRPVTACSLSTLYVYARRVGYQRATLPTNS